MGAPAGGPAVKALSIRQPWVWAIVHAGKDIENRTWWTPYRGPVLIHAANAAAQDARHNDQGGRP
jgi:hypothetical protein